MVKLELNEEFKQRLHRIDSPIAKYLLKMDTVDETAKDYVNFIGVSRDNPLFISYIDKSREKKNKPYKLKKTDWTQAKLKYKRSAYRNYFYRGNKVNLGTLRKTRIHLGNKPEHHNYLFPQTFRKAYNKELTFNICDSLRQHLKNSNALTSKDFRKVIAENYTDWLSQERYIGSVVLDRMYYDITVSLLSNVSYIKGREYVEVVDPRWNPDKRAHASSGKIVKRIIGKDFSTMFTAKQLEDFTSQFKFQGTREIGTTGEFLYEEMEGNKIAWAYHEDNYLGEDEGTLGESCMRYDDCQSYFGIYTKNKNHVSIAVLLKDEKVVARSILWYPNSKAEPKIKYHDRIYYSNNGSRDVLRAHLGKLGYEDCYADDSPVGNVTIKLDHGEHQISEFPYMDTFMYLGDKKLSNYSEAYHNWTLQNTEGGPMNAEDDEYHNDDDHNDCYCCGARHHVDDLNYINRGYNHGDNLCDGCSTYCEDIGESVANRDAVYDNFNEDYIYINNSQVLYNGENTRSHDAVELHDGTYCHKNEEVLLSYEGDLYLAHTIDEYCIQYKDHWYEMDGDHVGLHEGTFYFIEDPIYIELISQQKDHVKEEEKQTINSDSEQTRLYYTRDSHQDLFGEWLEERLQREGKETISEVGDSTRDQSGLVIVPETSVQTITILQPASGELCSMVDAVDKVEH